VSVGEHAQCESLTFPHPTGHRQPQYGHQLASGCIVTLHLGQVTIRAIVVGMPP
jgi:hypothetical protein